MTNDKFYLAATDAGPDAELEPLTWFHKTCRNATAAKRYATEHFGGDPRVTIFLGIREVGVGPMKVVSSKWMKSGENWSVQTETVDNPKIAVTFQARSRAAVAFYMKKTLHQVRLDAALEPEREDALAAKIAAIDEAEADAAIASEAAPEAALREALGETEIDFDRMRLQLCGADQAPAAIVAAASAANRVLVRRIVELETAIDRWSKEIAAILDTFSRHPLTPSGRRPFFERKAR